MVSYKGVIRSVATEYAQALRADPHTKTVNYLLEFPENQRRHVVRVLVRVMSDYLKARADEEVAAVWRSSLSQDEKIRRTMKYLERFEGNEPEHVKS